MRNTIMEAGGKDRPPMLVPGTRLETYFTVGEDIQKMIDAELEAIQIILTGIDNDIYSTVDVCPNAKEIWKVIERLMHEWQRFVTIVKQSNDLKIVSYHKLFDILKQHPNEVNEIRAERLARNANPLALIATTQQQPVYYPQAKPNYHTQTSSTISHAATQSKVKEIAKAPSPPSESEHKVNIYKPTNNNLRTSSNTRIKNVDNSPRTDKRTRNERQTRLYENQRAVVLRNADQQSELRILFTTRKRFLCKQEEVGVQSSAAQHDWEVILATNEDTGPIYDTEPLEKVHSNYVYNVFANERQHTQQPESTNDTIMGKGDSKYHHTDSSVEYNEEG
ncbi:hypothetical protein Tco_1123576 [Tanacetum coccineum]|uniref:Gag protein n=1 Tax=Tanacetum coccineum TaxID=301880 RepID=A0ABQ5J4U1_9ASTR